MQMLMVNLYSVLTAGWMRVAGAFARDSKTTAVADERLARYDLHLTVLQKLKKTVVPAATLT